MKNNRKKLYVALLAAGVCVASTGYAALDGAYTTAQVGVAFLGEMGGIPNALANDLANDNGGRGPYFHFALGDQLNRYFALEVGVSAIPTTTDSRYLSDSGSASLYSLDGDVKAMLPLGDRFNIYAKIGPSLAYFEHHDFDNVSVMGNGAVGVAFDVTEHWTTDLSVGLMLGANSLAVTSQLGLGYHFA